MIPIPTVTQLKSDPREEAWVLHRELCHMLSGDSVLVPFTDGEPDWSTTTRATIEKINDWSDLAETDIPRLAILTDGFQRFIGKGDDVSVVTLWRSGTPVIHQIDGEPCVRAVDAIMDAISDDIPLAEVPAVVQSSSNIEEPSPMMRKLSELADRFEDRQAKRVAANDNKPASGPLTFVNPADWHGKPVPEREWYAPDLVPLRQVTILNGDGGTGKSLLSLQLAAAGAMGVDTLDMAPMPGRTLYVGAEDEAEEFWRRLVDIAAMHRRTLADLSGFRLLPLADRDALLSVPNNKGNMAPTLLMASLIEFATDWKPRLIVFDTAADLFGGDEIKRGQVRQFISQLRHIAIGLDCAVILLAHPSVQGMQSGSGSSGSTAWNNSVRSRLYLTRPEGKDADPDLRILTTKKINYGKVGGELKLRWKDGAFVLDDGKPPIGSMLVAAKAERVFRDLLSLFNRTGQNVSDVTGTSYAPAKMAGHPEADGLSKKALAGAMQRLLDRGEIKIVKEGPVSRQRKRLILSSEDYGAKDE